MLAISNLPLAIGHTQFSSVPCCSAYNRGHVPEVLMALKKTHLIYLCVCFFCNRCSSNSLCPFIKINILDRLVYYLCSEVTVHG